MALDLITSVSELKYPGVYLKISGPDVSCIVPYHAPSVAHSTSHEFSKPVSEFFEWLKDNAGDVARSLESAVLGTSIIKEAAEAAYKLTDIFGLKLYNKKFFANAWKGTQPSEVSFLIELKTGWRGDYSGKSEVYGPIKHMYRGTVPGENKTTGFLTSPGPTVASVAGAFIAEYIEKAGKAVKKLFDDAAGGVTNANQEAKGGAINGIRNLGQWRLTLFTAFQEEGAGMKSMKILDLSSLVCKSASINMDTTVDTEGYPIKGSINLAFMSSDITTENLVDTLLPGPTEL